jgi:hypothetical protein
LTIARESRRFGRAGATFAEVTMSPYRIRRRFVFAAMLVGAVALSGCQTTPTTAPTPRPAPPDLQLLEAQPLAIAEDCQASGSYFVEFTVLSDGRTGNIQAPPGPACMQQALTAWVSTFRYAPPGRQIPAGVEWMMVTSRRGS